MMKIIGHRGAKGLAPENSRASFDAAIKHNVDELELDVRVTADNVPVLIHDHSFTDGSGLYLVRKTSYDDLYHLKSNLMTLSELFEALRDKQIPLLIEIKPGESVQPITAVIREQLELGWKAENVLVASFSQKILREVHKALPLITMVVNERWSGVRASYRARRLHTKRISMNQRWLWSGFIRQMARGGYQLAAYTLNDVPKARRWQTVGLYAAITDFPDTFEPKPRI